GPPKSASYKGSVTLNGQTIQGAVDATLGDRSNIVADLKANVIDLDQIGGAGGRGQSPSKPIDTSPFRRADGTFKFAAVTLVSSGLRINNAEMAATLKDGVLTISYLKGALQGG